MSVSFFLQRWLLIPIVALWALHLSQRRFAAVVGRKRHATLALTSILIVIWIVSWFFARFTVPDIFLVPVAALAAAIVVWQRKVFFPIRLRCGGCRAPLSITRILYHESNLCEACEPEKGHSP